MNGGIQEGRTDCPYIFTRLIAKFVSQKFHTLDSLLDSQLGIRSELSNLRDDTVSED